MGVVFSSFTQRLSRSLILFLGGAFLLFGAWYFFHGSSINLSHFLVEMGLEESPPACEDVKHRLADVMVPYYDFEGKKQTGKITVLKPVAKRVEKIFLALADQKFPIRKMEDSSSKEPGDATTGAYDCRNITAGKTRSLHSYGLAIDLNYKVNPYLLQDKEAGNVNHVVGFVLDTNRIPRLAGEEARIGLVEGVVDVFAHHGFHRWGGYWDTPIDYQHFEVSRNMANLLVGMSDEDGERFFEIHVLFVQSLKPPKEDITSGFVEKMLALYYPQGTVQDLLSLYKRDKAYFFKRAREALKL